MANSFLESTLVMVAAVVVLTTMLSVGSVLSGIGVPKADYAPVKSAYSGYKAVDSDSGSVSFSLGASPLTAESTANIILGIAGG